MYLLHPVLIEVYDSVPWTRDQNFVPMELLLVTVFVLVPLVCCGLTHRFIEAPMQRLGRRVARRLDVRFGRTASRVSLTGLWSRRYQQHHILGRPPIRERHETPDPVRSDALESRFHCVRHDGYPAWPSLLARSAATPFLRRSFSVSALLSVGFRVPFRRAPGTPIGAS